MSGQTSEAPMTKLLIALFCLGLAAVSYAATATGPQVIYLSPGAERAL